MIATLVNRRNITQCRGLADRILRRAQLLDPADRQLLRQVLERDVQPTEIAPVVGRSVRSVQRRVNGLINRLEHPATIYILRRHPTWPPQVAHAAIALFIRARTIRQVAAELGVSLHRMRQIAGATRSLVEQGIRHGPARRTRHAIENTD